MSTELAATILAGEIFFGIIFAVYLYKSGKRLQIKIIDREDS